MHFKSKNILRGDINIFANIIVILVLFSFANFTYQFDEASLIKNIVHHAKIAKESNLNTKNLLVNNDNLLQKFLSKKKQSQLHEVCFYINKITANLVDLDNTVSTLRVSFLNHTKIYSKYDETKLNLTGNLKFKEIESQNFVEYINKINQLDLILQYYRDVAKKFPLNKKCIKAFNDTLEYVDKNIQALIKIIETEALLINLPINFVIVSRNLAQNAK